ncbi:MAG TPA: hypothetical protein VMF06_18790 [Candidatus Limnocylindria bacterium]|jgi:hypothetical protein|nr:hypothetical protein [Candidatus Limnocylindria bacterium]
MNIISTQFQASFDEVRRENLVRRSDFLDLFSRSVYDQWPLQSRVYEFDFLSVLDDWERDKEIVRYAVQCFRDVQDCARELRFDKVYVCCIVFDDEIGMWPELYFFNDRLAPLSMLKLHPPKSQLGRRLVEMLTQLGLSDEAKVCEEHCQDPDYTKVYIDFVTQGDEMRLELLAIASRS